MKSDAASGHRTRTRAQDQQLKRPQLRQTGLHSQSLRLPLMPPKCTLAERNRRQRATPPARFRPSRSIVRRTAHREAPQTPCSTGMRGKTNAAAMSIETATAGPGSRALTLALAAHAADVAAARRGAAQFDAPARADDALVPPTAAANTVALPATSGIRDDSRNALAVAAVSRRLS